MIKARLVGKREVELAVRELGEKHLRAASRVGVTKASQMVNREAKARVPARTGSLKKALGYKVQAKKNKTGYVGVVGPRRDNTKAIRASMQAVAAGKRKRALKVKYRRTVKYQGRELLVDPVKYAHLVEYGRRAVRVKKKKAMSDGSVVYGKATKSVPPRPFLRPAWEANKGSVGSLIRQAMKQAAAKAAKRRKR